MPAPHAGAADRPDLTHVLLAKASNAGAFVSRF